MGTRMGGVARWLFFRHQVRRATEMTVRQVLSMIDRPDPPPTLTMSGAYPIGMRRQADRTVGAIKAALADTAYVLVVEVVGTHEQVVESGALRHRARRRTPDPWDRCYGLRFQHRTRGDDGLEPSLVPRRPVVPTLEMGAEQGIPGSTSS